MKLLCLLLIVLSIMSSTVEAQFISGHDLLGYWKDYQNAANRIASPSEASASLVALGSGIFVGYVCGVADAWDRLLVRVPDGTTKGQICAIVGKYLENNPAKWSKPAEIIVGEALTEAFGRGVSEELEQKRGKLITDNLIDELGHKLKPKDK